ncbi:MAG: AbrB/MazE/SpoVT family DNA-binding domain-containing protein [Candidatus Korarchaeota archaeon]|nr:AbrB/MazE/SpoVT family DNA-binding domain-containing protein [Candidatus Korarchaeota archaeon]
MKIRLVRGLVRLPREVLESLGWRDGMVVKIEADGDKVVIRPAFPTSCTGMVG